MKTTMNLKEKARPVLVLGIFVIAAFLLLTAASLIAPYTALSAIKCSPVITQTNLGIFGELTRKLTSDYLISQAKAWALSKLKLEYLQGSFGEMLVSGLTQSRDISGTIAGIMDAGLTSELSLISKQMSPEALMAGINSSAGRSLEEALKGLDDMPNGLVEQTVDNYTDQFLERSGFNSYKAPARVYQRQMANFMNTAADVSKKFLDFGQSLDVSRYVQMGATSGPGAILHTRTVTNELDNFVANGIQDTKLIWGSDVGVQVETGFTRLNESYLRRQLEGLKAKGVTSLTDARINEIIAATNNKALNAVSSHLADTADRLMGEAYKVTSYAQNTLGIAIGRLEQTLQQAMSIEKKTGTVATAVSENVRRSVQSAFKAGKWRPVAAAPKPLPHPFTRSAGYSDPARSMQNALTSGTWTSRQAEQANAQNAEDTKQLAIFLAGEGKIHSDVVKTNVKYFLVAKESGDVARDILQKLQMYNAAATDKATDDAAWKDAARFQYYALMLQNQQMKLVAAKAMAIGMNLKALDNELGSFIDKTGLPDNF